jgi:hypothetical protein
MKKIFLLSLTLLFFIPEILADKRAPRGECYISIGYVNDRAGVAEFAKNSFIKPENFELFEREDKKVYLTLGKIDENLFKKLQSQNKTYDFNCSRGKGYEERLGLNSDFLIIGGNKINIVSAEQFISVVSSIEIEKQRLVDLEVEKKVQARLAAEREKQKLIDLEVQKQVQARIADLEKESAAKEVEKKESQLIVGSKIQTNIEDEAMIETQINAQEEAEKEQKRLAQLEQKRILEAESAREKKRLALLESNRKEQEAIEAERKKLSEFDFNISCASMLAEVDANEARASAKYLDKTIKISGRVDSIQEDMWGDNVVNLSSGDEWSFTSCNLYDVPLDTAISLDKGQNVTFKCDSFKEVIGSASLSNCKKI